MPSFNSSPDFFQLETLNYPQEENAFRERSLNSLPANTMRQSTSSTTIYSAFETEREQIENKKEEIRGSWDDDSKWENVARYKGTSVIGGWLTFLQNANIALIVSRDATKKNAKKQFFYSSIDEPYKDFVNYILSLRKEARYHYEFMAPCMPLKLYFDFDAKITEDMDAEDVKQQLFASITFVKEKVKDLIKRLYPKEYNEAGGITGDDWLLSNSSDIKTKLSYHLIFPEKFYFENMGMLKLFISFLDLNTCAFYDKSPYGSTGQSLRITGNYKRTDFKNPRYLKIEACPGFTPEECEDAEKYGNEYYEDGTVPIEHQQNRGNYKEMMLKSMITYIPANMVELKQLKEKLKEFKKNEKKIEKNRLDDSPENTVIPFLQDEKYIKILKALVARDPDCVETQPEWIKIGLLLTSAGAKEETWVEFSRMSKKHKLSDKELHDQWAYFSRQRRYSDPGMFLNYAKVRVPEVLEECKLLCIERMDKTPASIATTLASLYGDEIVYDANTFFYKEGILWKPDSDNIRLGAIIMGKFQKELSLRLAALKENKRNLKDGRSEEELNPEEQQKIDHANKRISILEDVLKITGAGRLGQDWYPLKVFFSRDGFAERLDEKQTILVFDNTIVDLEGEIMRDKEGKILYEPILEPYDEELGICPPRIGMDGEPIQRPKKTLFSFEGREPQEYTDENGVNKMEFVSKTCGYTYYSMRYIINEASEEYRKKYKRHRRALVKYLDQVFPDKELREYMLFFLALCLDGSENLQKFWFWTGLDKVQQGSNSKSFLKDICIKSMGEYAVTGNPALFTEGSGRANESNSALMALKGTRVVFFDEPDSKKGLKSTVIKRFTGGDQISARELHQSQQTFYLYCKPVVLCNVIPEPDQIDGGYWRRFTPVPFMAKFVDKPKDPKWDGVEHVQQLNPQLSENVNDWLLPLMHILLEKLAIYKTPEGEELKVLRINGTATKKGLGRKLKIPKIMEFITSEIKAGNNLLKSWIEEIAVQDPQGVIFFKDLKRQAIYNEDIKNFRRGKSLKEFVEELSMPEENSGGGLGDLWGSKQFSKRGRKGPYTVPGTGETHRDCWGGWRLKTDSEIEAEDYERSVANGSNRNEISNAFADDE